MTIFKKKKILLYDFGIINIKDNLLQRVNHSNVLDTSK